MDMIRNLFGGGGDDFRVKDGKAGMRAVVYKGGKGEKGELEMAADIKYPSLTSTEVLVKVHSAALNHIDYKKSGKSSEPVGVEFVGTIEKLGWIGGDRVHMFNFAIGDVVMGVAKGAVSEFVKAEGDKISFRPDGMPDEQAAAFPVSGMTAYQALMGNKFTAGQTIMVIGASDATGAMCVLQAQLLKAGKIIAVDSSAKLEFLESLGVDEVVDYESQAIEDVVAAGECDLVVDAISDPAVKDGPHFEKQVKPLLKKGGKVVSINSSPLDQMLKNLSVSMGFNVQRGGVDAVVMKPKTEEIKQLADWFESGKLTQKVDSVIPFDAAAVAAGLDKLKAGEATGKIVVQVRP